MRIALIVLCIGAVAFLLRVLEALVNEIVRLPRPRARVHFARFNVEKFGPPQRPAELIEMNPQPRQASRRAGERIAM